MTPPDLQELVVLVLALAVAGTFAGLIAGMFGVGGGTVLVPAIFHALGVFGLDGAASLHVAVGTSLSTIIATSWRSLRAHRAHGAVDEDVLKAFTPWIAAGALLGTGLAALADKAAMGAVYGVCAVALAAHMAFTRPEWTIWRDVPTGRDRALVGVALGGASAMMGIGGGAFGSAMMTLAGRPIHQAVATASGFGVAIAIPATLGFIVAGWDAPGRPPLSLGHVNVPGFLVLAVLTSALAPLGARLAHEMSKVWLRRAFAVWLAVTAAMVAIKALTG